jgi:hypothetical protein
MAFPTAVNSQITDSVSQVNTKVLGDAPAIAMGNLFVATSQALSNAAHNATNNQQQSYVTMQASTTQGVHAVCDRHRLQRRGHPRNPGPALTCRPGVTPTTAPPPRAASRRALIDGRIACHRLPAGNHQRRIRCGDRPCPSFAMSATYLAMADSLGLAMQNAVANQQRGQVTAGASLAQVLALIIQKGAVPS